ncbi:MAG: hypothetical protein PHT40_02120 [Patescibacteria group bacterium]|nr:hypothetical protein [Patescibacteria group bacterium]
MKEKSENKTLSIAFGIILGVLLFFFGKLCLAAVFPGIDLPTFEERRAAYIKDQGQSVSGDFPYSMRIPLFAWLETPEQNKGRISEEIGYMTSMGDDCSSGQQDWSNCWWTGDHPNTIVASYVYYKYYQDKKVIYDSDAARIREKLFSIAEMGTKKDLAKTFWGCDGNYFYRYFVTGYLYAVRIGGLGKAYFDNVPTCANKFTYQGRKYTSGNYYEAKQFYSDYLGYTMDSLLKSGDNEDFGNYYYSQIQSIAAVYDFSPDAQLKRKAKMLLDWLNFTYAVGFSVGHFADGHGRTYFEYHGRVMDNFPFSTFFYLDKHLAEQLQMWSNSQEFYISAYRYPEVMRKIFEKINGPNMSETDGDYYRIVRGNDPRLGCEKTDRGEKCYRYEYVTPYYNLGGSGLGTGWELNIKSETLPFRVWINSCNKVYERGCNGQLTWGWSELFRTGALGYQYKNAIFYYGGGNIQQEIGNGSWSETAEYDYKDGWGDERKWQFFRKEGVAVAAEVRGNGPSALEVVKLGVDYPDFNSFIGAVKRNSKLSWDGFTTSKGFTITKGFVDYGSEYTKLPFDRLEVWEGHVNKNDEKKIVDWNNNVMTVTQGNLTCKYNFNSWTFSGNGCAGQGAAYKADFNCDGVINISDFGILLSHWGQTEKIKEYQNAQCGVARSLDLAANNRIDTSDLSALLSCWGTPEEEVCMEK